MKFGKYALGIVSFMLALGILTGCARTQLPGTVTTDGQPLNPGEQGNTIAPINPPESTPETTDTPDSTPAVNPPQSTDEQTVPPIEIPLPPKNPTLRGDEIILDFVDGECEWTAKSRSGTRLNLYAECKAKLHEDRLYVHVDLFLQHTSIICRNRDECFIRIGDTIEWFETGEILQDHNTLTNRPLTTIDVSLDPSEVFVLEALMPFYGEYAGVEINLLTLNERYAVIR